MLLSVPPIGVPLHVQLDALPNELQAPLMTNANDETKFIDVVGDMAMRAVLPVAPIPPELERAPAAIDEPLVRTIVVRANGALVVGCVEAPIVMHRRRNELYGQVRLLFSSDEAKAWHELIAPRRPRFWAIEPICGNASSLQFVETIVRRSWPKLAPAIKCLQSVSDLYLTLRALFVEDRLTC